MSQTPRRDDTRQRILDAAVDTFARDGRHATRIQDIADAAGVAYGLVYHYFGSKTALLETIVDENWGYFSDVIEGLAGSGKSTQAQLISVLDYVMGALDAYPERVRVIIIDYGRSLSVGAAFTRPPAERALAGIGRLLRDAHDQALLVDHVDPDVLTSLLVGVLEAAVVRRTVHGAGLEDSQKVRSTVQAVLRGIFKAQA